MRKLPNYIFCDLILQYNIVFPGCILFLLTVGTIKEYDSYGNGIEIHFITSIEVPFTVQYDIA